MEAYLGEKEAVIFALGILDKELTRASEDLIFWQMTFGYTPHESTLSIIEQKKVLRNRLREIEAE